MGDANDSSVHLDDAGIPCPCISLNSFAVPPKSLPTALIASIAFAKGLVNLTAFPTFLSIMISSLPLRGTILLGGHSYTTPNLPNREIFRYAACPPVPVWGSLCVGYPLV